MNLESMTTLAAAIVICLFLIVTGAQLMRGHWTALLAGRKKGEKTALKKAQSSGRVFLALGVVALIVILVNTFVLHKPV